MHASTCRFGGVGLNSHTVEKRGDGDYCNLWGYPCETTMEGGKEKSVVLHNYPIIVSMTVNDCFVY